MKEVIKLYKGKVKIFFEEKDWAGKKIHYYTDENDNKLISVTSVTGLVDKSNLLLPWATRKMGEYLLTNYYGQAINESIISIAQKEWRRIKEEAADIGTLIHDYAEQKIKGLKPKIPEDEKVRNGAEAFLKWMKTHKLNITNTERIVYSKKHNFAGKCDWFGKDGKAWVIGDYKSSKGIYPEMFLQISAYWGALEEEGIAKFDKGYLVKFGKDDGNFESREISRKDLEKNYKAFLGLLEAKKRLEEIK